MNIRSRIREWAMIAARTIAIPNAIAKPRNASHSVVRAFST
jgi:hypothetical protein